MDSSLQICLVGGGKVGQDVHHTEEPGHLSQSHLPLSFLAGCDEVLEPYTEDPVSDSVREAGPNVSNNPVKVRGVFHTGLQQSSNTTLSVTHHVVHSVLHLCVNLAVHQLGQAVSSQVQQDPGSTAAKPGRHLLMQELVRVGALLATHLG